MTGLVALVGGDPFTPACTFDRRLIESSGADEVVVLPTAAAYEHPQRLVDEASEWFRSLGVETRGLEVLTRPHALDPVNVEVVGSARFVYLVGGSAMHVRSVLMQSPLWDALVAAWESGASVAGALAGAQVLGDPMVDSRGGAFTVGLGLLPGLAVIPEHDVWRPDTLHRTRRLAPAGVVLLGVDRATAAIRHPDRSWETEGGGEVVAYVGGEEVPIDGVEV